MELCKVNAPGTLFGSSTKHRFNGVVPHRSKAPGHSIHRHVRRANGKSALVTGGVGYFGYRLGCTLTQAGVFVILVDIHKPRWRLPEGVVFLQLHKEQIESVNIGGTRQIIDGDNPVCFHQNIPSLIYTSTVNVVFGGQQIDQGDEETVPYVPLHKHVDHYSKTKAIADQMVLAADGTPLEVNIERRLFSFTFGNPDAKMNWVHVDNLVQAHILAGEALTAAKGHIASGQVYYINDGEAVNVFDWLTPLFMKLGYKPWLHLPVHLTYMAAILMEYLHMALKPMVEISPLLTRNEVRNIAVTHTFKIDKARKQLRYCPKKYSFSDSVEYYIKTRPKQENSLSLFLKALFILSIIFLLICLSSVPQTQSPSAMQFSKVNQH